MIVVPELSLVILQPPRTGSTSLRAAILERHPRARSLYRHLERNGIPAAYRDFDVACMIRDPLERLHSLWRYMRTRRPGTASDNVWAARMARDAARPFADWLARSRETFTYRTPVGAAPHYHGGLDATPAARKSLRAWARPDLGPVELLWLDDRDALEVRLDIRLPRMNAAAADPFPAGSAAVDAFLARHHAWDLALYAPQATPARQARNATA